MKKLHRAVFPIYNTGIAAFFTIAVILVILFVNIGLSVNNTQKEVVDDALDEIDERLVIAGKISAFADVSSHKIMATATPVRTASDGAVNVDPQIMDVSYKLVKVENYIDNNELAVLAIVYADKDRPSSGEQLFIQANVPEGYVLEIDQHVPNISSEILNFGGIIHES